MREKEKVKRKIGGKERGRDNSAGKEEKSVGVQVYTMRKTRKTKKVRATRKEKGRGCRKEKRETLEIWRR